MIRRRRGISPVIAIVILIAVAVALGIAVAFWATGLIGTLGKVEKLEIRTAYAETKGNGWTITMSGANTGTADITIVQITINGRPFSGTISYSIGEASSNGNTTFSAFTIKSGQNFDLQIYLFSTTSVTYSHGQTIEVALISGTGTAFKRTVVLP